MCFFFFFFFFLTIGRIRGSSTFEGFMIFLWDGFLQWIGRNGCVIYSGNNVSRCHGYRRFVFLGTLENIVNCDSFVNEWDDGNTYNVSYCMF